MAAKKRLSPRKKPKQERARQTVEAILEAAAQVFDSQGYARSTTDRIAERAGVSVGSLYQYFPGKDAILVALAERHADEGVRQVRALLAAVGGKEGLARVKLEPLLRLFIERLVALHQSQPRLHRLLFVETPLPKQRHQRLQVTEDELAAELVRLFEDHPEVRVENPELAAWMIVHASHGLVHDFIVHPPPAPFGREDFVRHMVELLAAYLTGRARHAGRARRAS